MYPLTYHNLDLISKIALDMGAIIYGDCLFEYETEIISLIFANGDFVENIQTYLNRLIKNGIVVHSNVIFNGFAILELEGKTIEIFNDKKDIYPFYSHRLIGLSQNGFECLNQVYSGNDVILIEDILQHAQNKETHALTNLENDCYSIDQVCHIDNEIGSILISFGWKILNKN